ncbi:hypothetical protein NON20_08715 [Synechocystis sp. B12]|nr:hypothetical protein NON20_08715 [Synechocystis sp. B12]
MIQGTASTAQGYLLFRIQLSQPSVGDTTVNFALSGTGEEGVHYEIPEAWNPNHWRIIPDGETTADIGIFGILVQYPTGDKSIIVTLTGVTNSQMVVTLEPQHFTNWLNV